MKNRLKSNVNYLFALFLCLVSTNGQWDWDGRLMAEDEQGVDWQMIYMI